MSSTNISVNIDSTDTEVTTEVSPMDTNQRSVSLTEATDVHVSFQFTDVVTTQKPTSGKVVVHADVVPDSDSPMEKNQGEMTLTKATDNNLSQSNSTIDKNQLEMTSTEAPDTNLSQSNSTIDKNQLEIPSTEDPDTNLPQNNSPMEKKPRRNPFPRGFIHSCS